MKKIFLLLCLTLGLSGQNFAQNTGRRVTVWNGAQWSKGAPDAATDTVIEADLATSEDISAFNLTVRSNTKLTMTKGSKLKLFNDGVVEENGKLLLRSLRSLSRKTNLH